MTLPPGFRLGTYEILAPIGAGGMGEVYKARDPTLARMVAIKVLPPALARDPLLQARFEREARAVAALSHPNVLGIFDFGTQGEITYAVMELLEGESLFQRLKAGPVPFRRVLEIAIELANGLGAAHAQGIVHRDVKPGNIFLTTDGRVKVLDFGIAKLMPTPASLDDITLQAGASAPAPCTARGIILGTVGYMAPEQVKGEVADHRADIFAFGTVLYEMLAGHRPFRGESSIQTLASILEDDPPELEVPKGGVPPAFGSILFHCLEKEPAKRFQTMSDVVFALQNLSGGASSLIPRVLPLRRWSLRPVLLGIGAVAIGLLAAIPLSRKPADPPAFARLFHPRGTIDAARFGPDGRTVIFSLRSQGGRPSVLVLHPETREPQDLGLQDALLAGVSPSNELLLLRGARSCGEGALGTLATVEAGGGNAKDIQEHVLAAAWSGMGMATVSLDASKSRIRLEYMGRTLVDAPFDTRVLKNLCLSRDGERLALVDADTSSKTEIVQYDRRGSRIVLHLLPGDINGRTVTGLAWGAGRELFFSQQDGDQSSVYALSPGGRPRLRWRGPGDIELMDASADGHLLLARQQMSMGILVSDQDRPDLRNVNLRDGSQAMGLSEDGRSLAVLESPSVCGGSSLDMAYLLETGTGKPVPIGRGIPNALSGDGRWMQLIIQGIPPRTLNPAILAALEQGGIDLDHPKSCPPFMLLMPTGVGKPRVIRLPARLQSLDMPTLLPDGQHVAFLGNESGRPARWFLTDFSGTETRPVAPEGTGVGVYDLKPLSADGRRLVIYDGLRYLVQDLAGGDPRPVRGLEPGARVMRWGAGDRRLLVHSNREVLPLSLSNLDPDTGARQALKTFHLPDPSGFQTFLGVFATQDARIVAITYCRRLTDLFLVESQAR